MKAIKNLKDLLLTPEEDLMNDVKSFIDNYFPKSSDYHRLNQYIIKTNWKNIIINFDKGYEDLYSSFKLNKIQQGLWGNKILFKRMLFEEFKIFIKIKLIENKMSKMELLSFFNKHKAQHLIENQKLEKLNKLLEKFSGKKYKKENLDLYGKIYKKNDEFIELYGEGNYRKATKEILKPANYEKQYKAFSKFKNIQKILTSEEFQKYLETTPK